MNNALRTGLEALVGGAVLVAAVVWLSGGCGERIAPGDAAGPAAVASSSRATATVQAEMAVRTEQASGTVASARHATISSKILARIDEIAVRAGDTIEKGALVVRLDARDLEARLRAAHEAAASARAAQGLARSEQQRIAKLERSHVASARHLERATTALRMAQAELERTEQRVADAEVARSHGEIRSPVAGRVIDRLAEPGDTAAPGAPLLRIYDPGAMRLETPVREGLATRLVPGQTLAVRIEALSRSFEGTIDEIVPAAEPGARTFLVKIRLPQDARLYAGMFGRVSIPSGEGRRLLVPAAAVERIGQLEYVDVLTPEQHVARRMVTTGVAADAQRVEVLSGLSEGETVLLP